MRVVGGTGELWGARRSWEALQEGTGRAEEASGFPGSLGKKRETRWGGRRQARVPGAHLLRKGGIASFLGLCVREEICLNAQGLAQSHPVRGEV